ncbi:hypothetical protein K443DRAFT_417034 [Laccaria amethystina LaAM-08-1]|uniref:Uncharacterized protein n=1 Tax=Laccaria amethystina LaAM-08-1 TaxID=1095629 RepID=A0A0C9XHN6_9AGAR|nr:hypothetical protein K443DRAFT_417034 [Laccaria amethystina LaAM-08-1]
MTRWPDEQFFHTEGSKGIGGVVFEVSVSETLRGPHCVDLTKPGVPRFVEPLSLTSPNPSLFRHNNIVNFTPNCYSFRSKIAKQRRTHKGCMTVKE